MPDPVPTPEAPKTVATPPAPDAKPADAKPAPASTPAQIARQKLDEVTRARVAAENERKALEAKRAEVEPIVKKATEYESDVKLLAEDPKAFLEKHGIDRTALTEKLAAAAIADVEATTPEGQVAELKKQIEDLKAAGEKEKQDAANAAAEKQREAYRVKLVEAITPEKYPLCTNALDGLITKDEMKAALWDIGAQIWKAKCEGKTKEEVATLKEPTPDEVCAEAEKRYKRFFDALGKQREAPPAPEAAKKAETKPTQVAASTKLKDRKAKVHEEMRKKGLLGGTKKA